MVGYFADVILVCGLILSVKRTRSMNMVGNVCAISTHFMHCQLQPPLQCIDNADCVKLGRAPLSTLSSFPAHKTTEVSSFIPAFFCNLYR